MTVERNCPAAIKTDYEIRKEMFAEKMYSLENILKAAIKSMEIVPSCNGIRHEVVLTDGQRVYIPDDETVDIILRLINEAGRRV